MRRWTCAKPLTRRSCSRCPSSAPSGRISTRGWKRSPTAWARSSAAASGAAAFPRPTRARGAPDCSGAACGSVRTGRRRSAALGRRGPAPQGGGAVRGRGDDSRPGRRPIGRRRTRRTGGSSRSGAASHHAGPGRGRRRGRPGQPHRSLGRHHPRHVAGSGQGPLRIGPLRRRRRAGCAVRAAQRRPPGPVRRSAGDGGGRDPRLTSARPSTSS